MCYHPLHVDAKTVVVQQVRSVAPYPKEAVGMLDLACLPMGTSYVQLKDEDTSITSTTTTGMLFSMWCGCDCILYCLFNAFYTREMG